MRRALAIFLAGVLLGIVLTYGYVAFTGGWYEYRTLPSLRPGECVQPIPSGAEIVPHQPNPCHYRRPRWSFGS